MPKNVNKVTVFNARDGNGTLREVGRRTVVITGNGTPDYLNKVRLGQFLPPLSYTRETTEASYPIYCMQRWSNQVASTHAAAGKPMAPNIKVGAKEYQTELSHNFLGLVSSEQGIDSEAVCIAKAVQRFYDDAKSLDSSIGVTIAEAPRTFALIGDTAVRLAKAVIQLKHGRVSDAFKELSYHDNRVERRLRAQYTNTVVRQGHSASLYASQAWLEMQYGWKPLLNDVYSACSDLAQRFAKHPADISIRGGHSSEGSFRWNVPIHAGSGNHPVPPWPRGWGFGHEGECRTERKVGFTCYARVIDPTLRARQNLGMSNPLEIAWELLPWSFVVDWFVPIGPYIQALNATAGLTFTGGSRSILTRYQRGYLASGVSPTSASSQQFKQMLSGNCEYNVKYVKFVRTTMSNFPNPALMLRIKPLSEALNLTRAANGLALMRQVFGR